MHVTENMAQEAWTVLRAHYKGGPELDMRFPPNLATITAMYRAAAMETHPDRGGNAETFATIVNAQHVLVEWAAKMATARPAEAHQPVECPDCEGRGFTLQTRGFAGSLRRQCRRCNGTGDLSYDNHGLY